MNECNIIKDLLPLYIDDVLSEDSREMVEKHLKECAKCADELNKMREENINIPLSADIQKKEVDIIKRLKKSILNKKIIISFVSICVMIGIFMITYAALYIPKLPIKYDNSKMKVVEQRGDLYLSYDGNFSGSVEYNSEHDFSDENDRTFISAAIYLYDSPYTKYIKNKKSDNKTTMIYIGRKSIIDKIYYGNFDEFLDNEKMNELFDKKLKKIYDNKTLDKTKGGFVPKG